MNILCKFGLHKWSGWTITNTLHRAYSLDQQRIRRCSRCETVHKQYIHDSKYMGYYEKNEYIKTDGKSHTTYTRNPTKEK